MLVGRKSRKSWVAEPPASNADEVANGFAVRSHRRLPSNGLKIDNKKTQVSPISADDQ